MSQPRQKETNHGNSDYRELVMCYSDCQDNNEVLRHILLFYQKHWECNIYIYIYIYTLDPSYIYSYILSIFHMYIIYIYKRKLEGRVQLFKT